jgi:hypothetical protein
MKFELFLDANRLECRNSSVTCPIWIEVGDYAFPSKGWDDFPLALLDGWIDSASSGDKAMTFYFMDGPFRYNISPRPGSLDVIFYERDKEIARSTVDMSINEVLIRLKEKASLIIHHLAKEYPELRRDRDVLSLAKKCTGF